MKKLIIKTAAITFGVALVVMLMAFGICSFAVPQVMMQFTDYIGLEEASADYAYVAYQRSGEVEYIAHASEIAIRRSRDEVIILRLEEFMNDDQFAEYCSGADGEDAQPGGYAQYIYGNYACALYRTGEKQEATDFAFSVNEESFPRNNAIVALVFEAISAKDKAQCAEISSRLSGCPYVGEEYCQNIISILEEFANE